MRNGRYIHYDLQNIHNSSGAGSMHSTTEDLFRWQRGLHSPGVILNEQSIQEMPPNHYGIKEQKVQNLAKIFHGGRNFGFISLTYYNPEEEVSIIFLSNHYRTPMTTSMKDLSAIVFNKPYNLPEIINFKPVPLTYEASSEYAGIYEPEYEPSYAFTIYPVGNSLFYDSIVPKETVELFYRGNDTFYVTPESNDSIIFVRDENRVITGMNVYTLEGNSDILHMRE